MRVRHLCLSGLLVAALFSGISTAHAAILAQYDFEEFTTDNATWPANNGPYANKASSSLASVSDLAPTGLANLEALAVRDASHGDLPSYAVLIGAGSIFDGGNVTSADDNYYGFTVTANGSMSLTNLSFELGVSNSSATEHNASAQVYYNIDGGAFQSIGALQSRVTDPVQSFTGMVNSTIDLSGISLSAGQTAEIRLALANDRGYASSNGAVYVDNVVLEAVPEPASFALMALAGLGLAVFRRR